MREKVMTLPLLAAEKLTQQQTLADTLA